jgi:hypothetical protein
MQLAPIALFVYNRPDHTRQVLKCLHANKLSGQSRLVIYCDGPKENADASDLSAIDEVRRLCASEKWCGEVQLVKREKNMGLADSIVHGVTQLVNESGKVIVLEDDLVTSPGFLEFMNQALSLYVNEEKVMHLSAYMYPRLRKPFAALPDTLFIKFMACWGWATWKRAWDHYNDSAEFLAAQLHDAEKKNRFNLDGSTASLYWQLEQNAKGKLHTWAIKWSASIFLKDGLCLFPGDSLVKNIGNDGTGTHPDKTNIYSYQRTVPEINVKTISLVENKRGRKQISDFFYFLEKKKTLQDKIIEKMHLMR